MSALGPRRFVLWLGLGLAAWTAAILCAPLFGPEEVSVSRALAALAGRAPVGADFDIVMLQRLPRALLGGLAGGALALAGAAFQAVLRNPLAEPYTLGVASSGALGASVVVTLGLGASFGPFSSVQVGALAGAALGVLLVAALVRRRAAGATHVLLLAGVTLGIVSSALGMLLRVFASPHRVAEIDRWMMGGLDVASFDPAASSLPLLFLGAVAILVHARAVDQIGLGAAMARGRGVRVESVRRDIFLGGSAVTAAVVSVAGPIGFVGLIVPHAVRRLVPRDHRAILPVSFFGGGIFLVAADTAARLVAAPAELPVGILTAAIGGPVFLVLLARGRGEES